MSHWDEAVRSKAMELGFDGVGVARADLALDIDFERYEAFVDAGFHGGMSYLANHRQVRKALDRSTILSGAKSIICVVQRYAVRSDVPETGIVPRLARYARGKDYHDQMRRRLRKLADFMLFLQPGVRARPMIDTAPVLERAWAVRAGLGFIGKNGMLICPGMGSFVLLGEVVTTAELTAEKPMLPRCGRCNACIEACPTSAFAAPYVLDARKCISYLTIEHRGPWNCPEADQVAPRLFGCDTCQDVCPFNRGKNAFIEPGGPFDPLDVWRSASLSSLVDASKETFSTMVQASAMRRVSHEDWQRNLMACRGTTCS